MPAAQLCTSMPPHVHPHPTPCCRFVFHGVHMMLQFGSSREGLGKPWQAGEKRYNRVVFIGALCCAVVVLCCWGAVRPGEKRYSCVCLPVRCGLAHEHMRCCAAAGLWRVGHGCLLACHATACSELPCRDMP